MSIVPLLAAGDAAALADAAAYGTFVSRVGAGLREARVFQQTARARSWLSDGVYAAGVGVGGIGTLGGMPLYRAKRARSAFISQYSNLGGAITKSGRYYRGRRRGTTRRAFHRRGNLIGFRSMGGERKYLDTLVAITPGQTTNITCLNPSAQGLLVTNRLGNKIRVRSIVINFFIFMNTANTNGDAVRLTLVVDKQCNGALMANSDVYLNTTTSQPIYSVFNPVNLGNRLKIVKDVVVVGSGGVSNPKLMQKLTWVIRANMVTSYNGNTSTVAGIVSNSLCLLVTSYDNVNKATVAYDAIVRFTDE